MTQRKPGDYVINAELTDEQRERFVADCVAAGAYNEYDLYDYPLTRLSDVFTVGGQLNHWTEVGQRYKNNVTHEYKETTMTAQSELMRQIADAMERNPEGWWKEFEFLANNGVWSQTHNQAAVFMHLQQTSVRPKPRTYTLHIENMPEPLREEPGMNSCYWRIIPSLGFVKKEEWCDCEAEHRWLAVGLCYPDESTAHEALEKLTQAMGGGE